MPVSVPNSFTANTRIQSAQVNANFTAVLALTPISVLGDILYASSASAMARLAGNITTTTNVLTQVGNGAVSAAPAWATPQASFGTQTANLLFAGPSSGSAANPSFRTQVPADALYGWLSKSAGYTLAAADYGVSFSGMASNQTATLPTAVGVAGQTYKIVNNDTTYTLTINTTSSQTVGGRASATIVLAAALGDYIEVFSDGANWQITSKKETSILSATASGNASTGSANWFVSGSPSITIGPGTWRISCSFSSTSGTGTSAFLTIVSASGVYSGDGANSVSAPTTLAGTTLGGISTLSHGASVSGNGTNGLATVATMPAFLYKVAASSTIYGVPQVASNASIGWTSYIQAERVW